MKREGSIWSRCYALFGTLALALSSQIAASEPARPATRPDEVDIVQVEPPTAEDLQAWSNTGREFDKFLKNGLPNPIPIPGDAVRTPS